MANKPKQSEQNEIANVKVVRQPERGASDIAGDVSPPQQKQWKGLQAGQNPRT